MVMVNDIAQAVVSKNTKGTVIIVGLNTHQKDAKHGKRNVTSVRRRDTFLNAVIQELDPSLHITSLARNSMIWSRNPMAILSLNKTLSISSGLETT